MSSLTLRVGLKQVKIFKHTIALDVEKNKYELITNHTVCGRRYDFIILSRIYEFLGTAFLTVSLILELLKDQFLVQIFLFDSTQII